MPTLDKSARGAIVARYLSGQGCDAIGSDYGTSAVTIAKWLKRWGVAIRSHSAANRRSTFDHSFFSRPLTPESAYFAGLMMTDGSVVTCRGRYTIQLRLSKPDEWIIREFGRMIGYTGNYLATPGRTAKCQPVSGIILESAEMVRGLAALGVTARKTHTAEAAPELAMSADFWRGCWDGDGTVKVWVRRGRPGVRPAVGFVTASPRLADQCAAFLTTFLPTPAVPFKYTPKRPEHVSLYYLNFSYRNALLIARRLYAGKELAMPRKLAAACEVIRHYDGCTS